MQRSKMLRCIENIMDYMDKMPLWSNYGQNVRFKKVPNFLRSKTKKKFRKTEFSELFGGDKRDRTADLLNAIQALSQLSYTPIFCCCPRQLLYYSNEMWICQ